MARQYFYFLISCQEQVYKRVQHYAQETTEDVREQYQAAANAFRLPYWDWALGEGDGPIPDFFTAQMINVTRPNGQQQELWNPLYAFYFHPLIPGDFESKACETFGLAIKVLTIAAVGKSKRDSTVAKQ